MKTLTLNISEHVELDEKQTIRFLAAKLYEAGKLSLGQAANLAGLSKVAFAEILSDYDVAFFNYAPNEIGKDADTLVVMGK